MIKLKWLLTPACLIVIALILSVKTCRDTGADNAYLKGRETELVKAKEAGDKEAAARVAHYEERIAELQGHIDSANTVIVANEGIDKELAGKVSDLETAEATIQDKDELITNLRAQVETWRNRFSLAQQTIAEKDKIIFSLTQKYELQIKITLEKDGQILSREELLGIKDARISGLESELRKEKTWGVVKKYVALGALAYVAIDVATGFLAK